MSRGRPAAAKIRDATPLTLQSKSRTSPGVCSICGQEATILEVYRECDENDRPRPGNDVLIYIGLSHSACIATMEDHPRLYRRETGEPGAFPLCAPCKHRDGRSCRHNDLKANGGTGLFVTLTGGMPFAVVCGRNGRIQPSQRAEKCAGFEAHGHDKGNHA